MIRSPSSAFPLRGSDDGGDPAGTGRGQHRFGHGLGESFRKEQGTRGDVVAGLAALPAPAPPQPTPSEQRNESTSSVSGFDRPSVVSMDP
jgi:hypothetical protein